MWLLPIALVGAVVVYAQSLTHGFVWDDHYFIERIAYSDFSLIELLQGAANRFEYNPLRDLSYALDHLLWGGSATGYHVGNLVYFLLGLVFAWRTTRLLCEMANAPVWVAGAVVLLLALHPLATEPVNFITSRNTLLASLFLYLSLEGVLRGLRGELAGWILGVAGYCAALMSKATALFFPGVFLLLLTVPPAHCRSRRVAWAMFLLLAVITALALWVHMGNAMQHSVIREEGILLRAETLTDRLRVAFALPYFYLWKFVWPLGLTTHYNAVFLEAVSPVAAVAAALLLLGVGGWLYRNRQSYYLSMLGFGWFVFSLVPVSGLVPTSTLVADRYLFAGLFGLALMCIDLIHKVSIRYAVTPFLWGVPLVCLMAVGILRTGDWESDLTLMRAAYQQSPVFASGTYAEVLYRENRIAELIQIHEGNRVTAYPLDFWLGRVALDAQRPAEAVIRFTQAEEKFGKADAALTFFMAQALEASGQPLRAIGKYRLLLTQKGFDFAGLYAARAQAGVDRLRPQFQPRLDTLLSIASRRPDDPQAQADVAMLLLALGEHADAVEYFRRAARITPEFWPVYYNLGLAQMHLANYPDALASFEHVLRLDSGNIDAMHQAGYASKRLQDGDKAEYYYRLALEKDPGSFTSWFNLARLYFQRGNMEAAKEAMVQARQYAPNEAMAKNLENALQMYW